jgi:hypothetical protein
MAGSALCAPIARGEMIGMLSVISLLFIYLFSHLRISKTEEVAVVEDTARHTPLLIEVVTRVWSGALFVITMSVLLSGDQISIPMQFILCCVIIGGLFLEKPLFQSIFQISSMVSWFAIFDLFIFSKGDERIMSLLLSPKGVLIGFLASASILRFHLGNKWQFRDPSHLLIGLVLLLGYFWGVDLPACTLYNVDVICSLFGNTSNQYLHNSSSGRAVEVIKMLFAHILFNAAFYMSAAAISAADKDNATSGIAAPPVLTSSESSTKSDIVAPAGEDGDTCRRFSGATDTEQDDNMTVVDENIQTTKYPDDLEISEAEAIEIIQNGLNSFKKKRAT